MGFVVFFADNLPQTSGVLRLAKFADDSDLFCAKKGFGVVVHRLAYA